MFTKLFNIITYLESKTQKPYYVYQIIHYYHLFRINLFFIKKNQTGRHIHKTINELVNT